MTAIIIIPLGTRLQINLIPSISLTTSSSDWCAELRLRYQTERLTITLLTNCFVSYLSMVNQVRKVSHSLFFSEPNILPNYVPKDTERF